MKNVVGKENNLGCKGICLKHKAVGGLRGGRYRNGQKRCQVCDIFIDWDGLWCPCCGYKLRGKPRNLKYKRKFQESQVSKS